MSRFWWLSSFSCQSWIWLILICSGKMFSRSLVYFWLVIALFFFFLFCFLSITPFSRYWSDKIIHKWWSSLFLLFFCLLWTDSFLFFRNFFSSWASLISKWSPDNILHFLEFFAGQLRGRNRWTFNWSISCCNRLKIILFFFRSFIMDSRVRLSLKPTTCDWFLFFSRISWLLFDRIRNCSTICSITRLDNCTWGFLFWFLLFNFCVLSFNDRISRASIFVRNLRRYCSIFLWFMIFIAIILIPSISSISLILRLGILLSFGSFLLWFINVLSPSIGAISRRIWCNLCLRFFFMILLSCIPILSRKPRIFSSFLFRRLSTSRNPKNSPIKPIRITWGLKKPIHINPYLNKC